MEQPAEIENFAEPNPESDQWIRYLESHGVVRPIGTPDDPCKVIAIADDLWISARFSEKFQSHGWARPVAPDTERRTHGPQDRGNLQRPNEFIEDLKRRHFSARAGSIQIDDITVPGELAHIAVSVKQARALVKDDVPDPERDDEVYQAATLRRASQFVLNAAISFSRSHTPVPPAPSVSGGPDGSIDVVWRGERRTLYFNVPEDPDNVVTFFGTDQSNPHLKLRGEEDPQRSSGWLLSWLCE